MAKTVKVSDDVFDEKVLGADKPVLVDFWAEWCGPCHMIAPSVQEIADEQENDLIVAKMDIDDNPVTPGRYGIMSIPTLMLFKDGAVAAQKLGAMSKSQLTEFLDSNL